jgi:hypothetical protein
MNHSIAIAQVLGIVFAVTGLSVILDRGAVLAALEKVTGDRGFLWLWGFNVLTLGAVIVVLNHAWTFGLPLLITVLGLLTILKGALLLLAPGPAMALYRKCGKDGVLIAGGTGACLLGLVLLYLSFMK